MNRDNDRHKSTRLDELGNHKEEKFKIRRSLDDSVGLECLTLVFVLGCTTLQLLPVLKSEDKLRRPTPSGNR